MFKLLRSLLPSKSHDAAPAVEPLPAPVEVVLAQGVDGFAIAAHLSKSGGFPLLDWEAAQCWVGAIADAREGDAAWGRLERAWLEHLQLSLGSRYLLRESASSLLLATLEPNVANATLSFMSKTLGRITSVLDGIAQAPASGKDILIVFDDEDAYYAYVSQYYPNAGEFAASGGMYINFGCGHFATVKSDLHAIEPVIAHEMTHSCLSHLPIPAWLNEGLAVNTEQRLCSVGPSMFSAREMHAKHLAFWGDAEIQQFWSGKSFLRNDDGNLLSYDLARIIVSQLSADWPLFRSFVLHASAADAGAAAAAEHLDLDLGAVASALLERETGNAWRPNPAAWIEAPERGAF